MRFLLPDGSVVKGRSYDEVVARMADDKLEEPRTLESYRRAAGRRASEHFLIKVDTTTNKSFIKSLEAGDVIQRLV